MTSTAHVGALTVTVLSTTLGVLHARWVLRGSFVALSPGLALIAVMGATAPAGSEGGRMRPMRRASGLENW
ncbi:hypothetical protein ACIQU5_35110 [Streptomyces sp. NPDC090306]|uniref:hypothetical protein n=1 Tax=Streptomyces sp. NPDC090306 TaxID=3365961 RepID=UPI00380DBC76